MKKISYLVVFSLFLSSAITLPLDRADFLAFKEKLSGYRECILRKRPCTTTEKAILAGIIITLLTFVAAISFKMGRAWYQQQMALSWDGIMQLIDQYEKDVKAKLPQSQFVPFNFTVLKKFQDVIEKKGLNAEEKNKINQDINRLTGGGPAQGTLQLLLIFTQKAGLATTYDELDAIVKENLKGLEMFTNLKPEKVYTFLGLTPQQGIDTPGEDIKSYIEEKISKLQRHTPADLSKLRRQLRYLFNTPEQKKRYDAYISGAEAIQKLEIIVDQSIRDKQVQNIQDLITELLGLQNNLK